MIMKLYLFKVTNMSKSNSLFITKMWHFTIKGVDYTRYSISKINERNVKKCVANEKYILYIKRFA